VGEIPAAVGGAALVIPPGGVDALTEALRRLLRDPALRAELAGRARALAIRQFDVTAMVAATTRVYDEVLEDRRDRRAGAAVTGREVPARAARSITRR